MKRDALLQTVLDATESLEGQIKDIDRDTELRHHEVLYRALDALEQTVEHLTEENG